MKIRFYKCEKCHGRRIPEGCPKCDKGTLKPVIDTPVERFIKAIQSKLSPDHLDSLEDFHEIMRRVMNGYEKATMASGLTPSEVWIGPKEVDILANHYERISCNNIVNQSPVPQKSSMEGSQLMGLTVRIMAIDGVRVGCSWEGGK